MIHLLKLKNGVELEINQVDREFMVKILGLPRETRPDFIEIESVNAVISISSIAAIIPYKHEPERLPTTEEELKVFNERWDRDHPK